MKKKERKTRIVEGKRGSVKELMDFLSKMDPEAKVETTDLGIRVLPTAKLPLSTPEDENITKECECCDDSCKCNNNEVLHEAMIGEDLGNPYKIIIDPETPIKTIPESVVAVYGNKPYTPYHTKESFEADNTAMTDISQRGTMTYTPAEFESMLPQVIRDNVLIERRNNSEVVEELLDIEEAAMAEKVKVDCNAIKTKADIDLEKTKLQLQTLLEYNTQTGMHRESAVMCQIVNDVSSVDD
jgi:hypothetical protein